MDIKSYRKWRSDQIKRQKRDIKALRLLRSSKDAMEVHLKTKRVKQLPLTVYFPEHPDPETDLFPITHLSGIKLPRWESLSQWMKVQLAVLGMNEFGLVTFTANLHPELEQKWVAEGGDIRSLLRDRLRRLLRRSSDLEPEFCFVIEGHDRAPKRKTAVHIHGFVFRESLKPSNNGDAKKMLGNLLQSVIGNPDKHPNHQPRAVHSIKYHKDGLAYVNYLFKTVPTPDDRLKSQRLTMSNKTTEGTRLFWNMITARDDIVKSAFKVA